MKVIIPTFLFLAAFLSSHGQQKISMAPEYGQAWFLYKCKDYGSGFINKSTANNKFIAGVKLQMQQANSLVFYEVGLNFSLFQQYYSTRKYISAWEERYPVILLPMQIGRNLLDSKKKTNLSVNGGVTIGILPERYDAEYGAIRYLSWGSQQIDSITRGIINRNYTRVFPLFTAGMSFSYKINKRIKTELKLNYNKGVMKITQYDAYYNDGSGANDQHAKQWGTGDFYSVLLSVQYTLKNKQQNRNLKE